MFEFHINYKLLIKTNHNKRILMIRNIPECSFLLVINKFRYTILYIHIYIYARAMMIINIINDKHIL